MKKNLILILGLCFVSFLRGQTNPEYDSLANRAYSLYKDKQYEKSAFMYSSAFKTLGGKGKARDRYNAACSWALAGYSDSAFFNLERIANKGYSKYNHLVSDNDLISIHNDKRWEPLIEKVKINYESSIKNYNKPLAQRLDSVYMDDQKYRHRVDEIQAKYGFMSKEMRQLWDTITQKDAVNLKKVTAILDKYGWLGADEVGQDGNLTLFLVIQHSDLTTQEKYLPMMREAVKNGKAQASSLALLEDRVLLGQGKKQIYGSQLSTNAQGKTVLSPLEDPDNVDRRRAEVGLEPLAEYLKHWNLVWNVEEYKKGQK